MLRALPVGLVLDGRDGVADAARRARARPRPRRRGVRRVAADAGQVCAPAPLELRVLWPAPRRRGRRAGADPNLRAVVAARARRRVRRCCSPPTPSPRCSPGSTSAGRRAQGRPPRQRRPGPARRCSRACGRGVAVDRGRRAATATATRRPSTLRALRAAAPRVYRTDRDGTRPRSSRVRRTAACASPPAPRLARDARLQARLPHPRRRPRPHRRAPRAPARARRARVRRGGVECFEGDAADARGGRRRARRDDVRDRAAVRDRRRRRALEGRRRRAAPRARARRASPPTPPSPSSPARTGRAKAPRRSSTRSRRPAATSAPRQTLKAQRAAPWVAGARPSASASSSRRGAAQALVAHVGERQQRLLRELEKLALEHGPGARIGVEEVEAAAAHVGRAPGLGARRRARRARPRRRRRAPSSSCAPRASRSPGSCRSWPAACATCWPSPLRLEAGESPAQIKASLKMGPWAADRRHRGGARAPTPTRCAARSRRSPTSSWPAAARASWPTTPSRCGRSTRSRPDEVGSAPCAALPCSCPVATLGVVAAAPAVATAAVAACPDARAPRVLYREQGQLESVLVDRRGRLLFTDRTRHALLVVARRGARPRVLARGIADPGGLAEDARSRIARGLRRTARRTPRPRTAAPPASTPSHPGDGPQDGRGPRAVDRQRPGAGAGRDAVRLVGRGALARPSAPRPAERSAPGPRRARPTAWRSEAATCSSTSRWRRRRSSASTPATRRAASAGRRRPRPTPAPSSTAWRSAGAGASWPRPGRRARSGGPTAAIASARSPGACPTRPPSPPGRGARGFRRGNAYVVTWGGTVVELPRADA